MAKQLDLYDTFQIKVNVGSGNEKSILSDSKNEVKEGYSLICNIDATHSGTLINNRIYPPASMKKGVKSWTTPFKKPVLVNHDDSKDPIGRVVSAKYEKNPMMSDTKGYEPILKESEGYGFQRLTVKITDSDAIQKVMDGRYETVSVRMSTNHCWCSVCNTDWSDGEPCEHTPGIKYDGKLAYMTTGDLTYREVSFVSIPADEYAGVKEAIIAEKKDSSEVSLYANNDSEKVLADLGSGSNLYTLLDAEAEASDDIVTYLLDKSNKAMKIDKEEDVKLSELTKEQLKDLDVVKSLVQEASDKAKQESKEECETAKKECKDSLDKLAEELKQLKDMEDAKKKKKEEEEKEEDEDAKKKKEMKKEEEEGEEEGEEEEDKKKKKEKKGAPVPNALPENKGKGKSGGVKHGAGNQGPVGEDPGDSKEEVKEEVKEEDSKLKDLEDANRKMLDENVRINSELHKLMAERLYDLKKTLRKPDVVGITTPDARSKKVEEFAQRSIDSLKDQVRDLLLEQENAPTTGFDGKDVENPAISPSDLTNEVLEDKKKKHEGKKDALTRLFPKSK